MTYDREKMKVLFLKEYAKSKTVSSAVTKLKISRDTVYDWFKQDPEFKQEFDDAKLAVGEGLESKAFQLIDNMVEKGDYGSPVLLKTL